MTVNRVLLAEYAPKIAPLLPLAQKAYGSRDTISPQHDASREVTRLLCEYVEKEGSLLAMADALECTYAGLRRRVTTKDIEPSSKRPRKRFDKTVYDAAILEINAAKIESTVAYHEALYKYWTAGLSLAKIASLMGLSSANPLYYGVNRIKLRQQK